MDKHTEENKSAISWALCVFLQPLKTTTTHLQGTAISGEDGEVVVEGMGWGDRQSFLCYKVSVFLSLQLKSDKKYSKQKQLQVGGRKEADMSEDVT